MSYFNTTHLVGKKLREEIENSISQEQAILAIFKEVYPKRLTPFDIQSWIMGNTPITSIRRAITCLTNEGHLEKTSEMRKGPYGKRSHTWRLAK